MMTMLVIALVIALMVVCIEHTSIRADLANQKAKMEAALKALENKLP